ncbi:subtilisin-like protease SBT4.3 [Rosa rugosa]|uniref:subtilisin-like protease SBT4.3 n=1 Tax=Rosa rugosa TaxID=74645 RepID=UPI002B409F9A|nr:subtilisin-like protease SBT4.3 [Rosa rugosa]
MAKHGALLFSYAVTILILTLNLLCNAVDEDRHAHVVYLGSLPDDKLYSPLSHHLSILQRVVGRESAANLLIKNYKRSFNGFSANLTEHEREELANMKEVVSVFPSTTFQLQTTRSWEFMGFNEKIRGNAIVESDVIIGVLDTGIWHESESFKDEGFGPAPKKWKGTCKGGQNFTCNNKLIGARFYSSSDSAKDVIGHGTHTASTAAGNLVKDVSFYGLAQGTARGGVPSARVAAYSVCSADGCKSYDILAAFDDAIADGVDIITVSLGASSAIPIAHDPIAIGFYHAIQKGILTTNAAGNNGPIGGTVSSVAPWMLTVAASSMDRGIIDKVVLGNGRTLVGNSVNSFTSNETGFPIVEGKDVCNKRCTEVQAGHCEDLCIDNDAVKGKIVLCDELTGNVEARRAGAIGTVLKNNIPAFEGVSEVLLLPAVALRDEEYIVVKSYMNSTKHPRANILRSEIIKDDFAPMVASFSSRGPNKFLPEIIKPDVSAPGVDILAAYSPVAPITKSAEDKRRVRYTLLSGTSMACPHAAGAAAYVKEMHPDWSPTAIKSSLMTTTWPMSDTSNFLGEYAYGSGHINPLKAIDPGLVYEPSKEDYINFLCMVFDEADVRLISGLNRNCPTSFDKGSPKDHNYPSLASVVTPTIPFNISFHRTVKNVGLSNSTYKAKILPNSEVDIKVVPEVLSFNSLNEEKTFDVIIVGKALQVGSYVSSSLIWSDGTHNVRSPILIS